MFLEGCSSTYTLKDYPSKQKFYEDFNSSVKGKDIKIILTNDSTVNSYNGAIIRNDSLIFKSNTKYSKRIPLKGISKISYRNNWLGIPSHLLTGSAAGFVAGFIIGRASDNNTQAGDARFGYIFIYTWIAGTVAGIIWGLIDGYTYTYQFNP